jgi:CDP-glucose 4,6-dehydratase
MGTRGAADTLPASMTRPPGVDPEFWRGRRVLVTGLTGFQGSWLALWLGALGARVWGLARRQPGQDSLYAVAGVERDATPLRGDIRDFSAVSAAVRDGRPEVVVHMAAQSLVPRSLESPRETYESNVMGTINLLEAVRTAPGVRVVVNVTSSLCYEPRSWEWGLRETDPLGGADPYSSSKACAELATAAYRRSFFHGHDDGPRLATARAGNVIGGGDWGEGRLVPDLMRAALSGRCVRVRDPDAVRPWQHVLEPVRGYLVLAQALWESADCAQAWNFAPAEDAAFPVRNVVEHVAARWSGGLRWEAAAQGPQGARAAPPAAGRQLRLDSSKARTRLQWKPRWDLPEALDRVVDWHAALQAGADMRELSLAQIRAHEA